MLQKFEIETDDDKLALYLRMAQIKSKFMSKYCVKIPIVLLSLILGDSIKNTKVYNKYSNAWHLRGLSVEVVDTYEDLLNSYDYYLKKSF